MVIAELRYPSQEQKIAELEERIAVLEAVLVAVVSGAKVSARRHSGRAYFDMPRADALALAQKMEWPLAVIDALSEKSK